MLDAVSTYGPGFVAGIGGGVCLVALVLFGIRRGLRRLAVRVSDLEDRYLSLNNKKAAQARWTQQAELEKAFAAKPTRQRYDNDPPEDYGV
jgi:hypothetical protein